MDRDQFKTSLDQDAPPDGITPLARALWLAAKCGGAADDKPGIVRALISMNAICHFIQHWQGGLKTKN